VCSNYGYVLAHIVSHTGNRYDTEVCSNYGYVVAHIISHVGSRYDTEVWSNYGCVLAHIVSPTKVAGMILRSEVTMAVCWHILSLSR
jgi:hypothetical protein